MAAAKLRHAGRERFAANGANGFGRNGRGFLHLRFHEIGQFEKIVPAMLAANFLGPFAHGFPVAKMRIRAQNQEFGNGNQTIHESLMPGAQLVGLDDIGNVEIFGGASFVDFGFGRKKNDVFHFQRPAAHGVNIQFIQQFQEYLGS